MSARRGHPRLAVSAIAAAKPRAKEYTLWDGTLAHFGVRVHPSGIKSYIVQTRVEGRLRKFTLGRFPELGIEKARRDAATLLARLWGGETVAPAHKRKAPTFRNFAARYREQRRYRWKPSSLETYDIYLRARLMPAFGKLRLDAITHARISAWFDTASAERPGAANRAFEILRAMLAAARQWGDLGEHVPDACANIVRNPRRPVARFLGRAELERLGAALDRHREAHPWAVAAIRLLSLTGARLSEVLNLKWDEIGEPGDDGASARLGDSKTGPRTIWLGPEAARLVAALPRAEDATRLFPEDLTPDRLYRFWRGVREDAGLPGLRIHDCRHTFASQGVMNGVGLTTVGHLLGHARQGTTAIYAHLDDTALQDAAAQAAAVIARAMGYPSAPPAAATTAAAGDDWTRPPGPRRADGTSPPARPADTTVTRSPPEPAATTTEEPDQPHQPRGLSDILRRNGLRLPGRRGGRVR